MERKAQLGGCTCRWYQSSYSRTRGASARSTSTRGCCASGWCSSGRRSTTTSRTWSSPSCSTSRPRTPTRTSRCTSTRPGGVVYAGLAIYDTMRFIKPDVATICCGIAMSMGSLILAGGARRQAVRAAELADPDPPADRRLPGPGHGHPDPRPRSAGAARAARGDLRDPHGQAEGAGLQRSRARPVLHAGSGPGLRTDRPRGDRSEQRQRLFVSS